MHPPIQIIIADDHELFINGLKLLLNKQPGISILDIARDGKELLQLLDTSSPDVILLDLNMPRLNGLETARFIKQSQKKRRIIVLSTYDQAHIVEKAKEVGVDGYLLKSSNEEELMKAIATVMAGGSYFPTSIKTSLTAFDDDTLFVKQSNLTRREREIISYIKSGCTNNEIAEKLFLSVYTVDTHRKNIMQKLQLKTPAALMKYIIENNLG